MALVLHGHPFSSYCQKVVIAFNETTRHSYSQSPKVNGASPN